MLLGWLGVEGADDASHEIYGPFENGPQRMRDLVALTRGARGRDQALHRAEHFEGGSVRIREELFERGHASPFSVHL